MTELTPRPARTLPEATAQVSFEEPLKGGDARYVDLSPARGDETRQLISRRLERKLRGSFLHIIFASHRGAGKSTELHQLTHGLTHRYRSLYLEANVEMDPNAIDMEDLLLVLAQQIEEQLRGWGYSLPNELIDEVFGWFAEITRTTTAGTTYAAEMSSAAGMDAKIPGLLSLASNLTALLRVDSSHKTEVKQQLRQYPGTLTERVNQLLDVARRTLKERENKELLIIIDNMDRYPPEVIDRLLLLQGDRFRSLRCDIIVTPPISLLYRPGQGQLDDYFDVEVMCSVCLRQKSQPYTVAEGQGANLLLQALRRRIEVDLLIPDPDVQKRFLVASGGSIRELLELVADASLYALGNTITAGDVEKAIKKKRSRMRDKINANGWAQTLNTISRKKQVTKDNECLLVLYQRLVFKYNNEYWYDIHPLVAEIPEVKDLLDAPP